MHEQHLGDSYDLVKRFLAIALNSVAPVCAHARFIPEDLRAAYSRLTTIPVCKDPPKGEYSLFLDPDTGIHLPNGINQRTNRKHVSLAFLSQVFVEYAPSLLICYDQGFKRSSDSTELDQRALKRDYLTNVGLESFYYVSHAPLLFVAEDINRLKVLANLLMEMGIPARMLEPQP